VGVCDVSRERRSRKGSERGRNRRQRRSGEFVADLARQVAGSSIKVQIRQAASKHDQTLGAPVKI
jgi:hypothetical protein